VEELPGAQHRRLNRHYFLGNPEKGSLPSKQEKVTAAKSAPVGENNPAESSFEGVAAADISKLNRPAMRAV